MRNLVNGTTIIISHQERILNIADKVILLKAGKVDKIGDKSDLFKELSTTAHGCCKLGGGENE